MAKVTFAKLGLKIATEPATFEQGEQTIEVKQYLPINDKLDLISRVINESDDGKGYYNIGKVEMYLTLEIIYAYTNVTFTDKQKENPTKLYDTLVVSDFYGDILQCMSKNELAWIRNTTYAMLDKIYTYKNSVYGILDALSTDYNGLNFDATAIQEKIADPENLNLLKEVLTKLG